MTQTLSGQAKLLLFVFTLFSFASLLSGTFVPVYLWKQTGSFFQIGLYILGQYVSSGIVFYLAGSVAKRGKKRLLLQSGCIGMGLFYAILLIISNQASHYIFLMGLLYGIGLALFWLAYNVLYFEISEPTNRDQINGWQGLLVAGCGIIAPWLASRLIVSLGAQLGYTIIFIYSFVLYAIIIVISFKLEKRPESHHFNWTYPFKALVSVRHNFRKLGYSIIAQGIREGLFLTLLPFVVFVTTKGEAEVGTYTLVTSLIALVSNIVIGKKLKPKRRMKALLIGAIGSWLAISFILITPTLTGLLMFGAITALVWPLFIIPFTSIVFDQIGKTKDAVALKEEMIVFRELALTLGRLIGLIPFFVYSIWLVTTPFHIGWLLLLVGIAPLLSIYFLKQVEKT